MEIISQNWIDDVDVGKRHPLDCESYKGEVIGKISICVMGMSYKIAKASLHDFVKTINFDISRFTNIKENKIAVNFDKYSEIKDDEKKVFVFGDLIGRELKLDNTTPVELFFRIISYNKGNYPIKEEFISFIREKLEINIDLSEDEWNSLLKRNYKNKQIKKKAKIRRITNIKDLESMNKIRKNTPSKNKNNTQNKIFRKLTTGLVNDIILHYYSHSSEKRILHRDLKDEVKKQVGCNVKYKKIEKILRRLKKQGKLISYSENPKKPKKTLCHVPVKRNKIFVIESFMERNKLYSAKELISAMKKEIEIGKIKVKCKIDMLVYRSLEKMVKLKMVKKEKVSVLNTRYYYSLL